MDIFKYQGIIPGERTEAHTRWLVAKGNMYAVIKGVLEKREGLLFGSVRVPLANLFPEDAAVVDKAAAMIDAAIARFI